MISLSTSMLPPITHPHSFWLINAFLFFIFCPSTLPPTTSRCTKWFGCCPSCRAAVCSRIFLPSKEETQPKPLGVILVWLLVSANSSLGIRPTVFWMMNKWVHWNKTSIWQSLCLFVWQHTGFKECCQLHRDVRGWWTNEGKIEENNEYFREILAGLIGHYLI